MRYRCARWRRTRLFGEPSQYDVSRARSTTFSPLAIRFLLGRPASSEGGSSRRGRSAINPDSRRISAYRAVQSHVAHARGPITSEN